MTQPMVNKEQLIKAVRDFADYMEERYGYFETLTATEKRKGIDARFDTMPVFNGQLGIICIANGYEPSRADAEITEEEQELILAFQKDWGKTDSNMFADVLKSDLLQGNPDAKRIIDTQHKFVILNHGGPVASIMRRAFGEVAGLFGNTEARDFARTFTAKKHEAEMALGLK